MILSVVLYPDPVLRAKGRPVTHITGEIRTLAANLLETMREAHGIGLAAHQVGVPVQLAVVDVSHDEECITYCRVNGEPKKLAEICPLIFFNPKIELGKAKVTAEEGCLSFPDLRENIRRADALKATLTLLDGSTMVLETDGLLSRAIQHETDHLNGVLFIDRMSAATKLGLKRKLRELMPEWEDKRKGAAPAG